MTRRTLLGLAIAASPSLDEFSRKLDDLRQRNSVPGLSAAVLRAQRLIWTRGFGYADVQSRTSATPETPYRIASLTKTFASMLLLQLYEQGRLDLDEPIRRYLSPSASVFGDLRGDEIKIRHVFTHTSEGNPGTFYRYNGARYAALTEVIVKLTGRPFRDVLAEKILDRLGMASSVPGQDSTEPRYQPALARLAKPYKLNDAGRLVRSEYPLGTISAAAGLISTVADLARYDVAIDRHVLIRKETQQKAWTPAVSNSGETLPYGLGWFIGQYGGWRLIWHYGYWPGSFSALYLKIPARNTTLFLLANSDGLSRPYPSLGAGDVTGSAFARLFLEWAEKL